jgi:transposase
MRATPAFQAAAYASLGASKSTQPKIKLAAVPAKGLQGIDDEYREPVTILMTLVVLVLAIARCNQLPQGRRSTGLTERFGDFRVVHTRFSRWAVRSVWKAVFEHLASDADSEYTMIDSTIVRAHQHSCWGAQKKGLSQSIGHSKGWLSTKIHTAVDALGNLIGFHLTEGQTCELDSADVLLPQLEAKTVIADKGFDTDKRLLDPSNKLENRLSSRPKKTENFSASTIMNSTRRAT